MSLMHLYKFFVGCKFQFLLLTCHSQKLNPRATYRIVQNFGVGIFWRIWQTRQQLPKISTLSNKANSMTGQPLKYHHPIVFSSFMRQKLALQNFAL